MPMKQSNVFRRNYQMYANETGDCMPMKLSEAADIAEGMLDTHFSTGHEQRQAEICV